MKALLNSLDARQVQIICYGCMALMIAALMVYLILPQWRENRAAANSLELLRSSVILDDKLDKQLVALQAEVDELSRTLNGDAANLPAKQMEAFVIGRLQTISWRNDMTLVSVQPREGNPVDSFRELDFDVELSGDYFKFFEWLNDIGTELGFVVIKRFDISSKGTNRGSDDLSGLQVNLTLAAYRSENS